MGRPGRRRVGRGQGRAGGAGRYKEAFDVLGQYVLGQGYSIRFALEPKPNEPREDILLPTVGHALAFINELEHPELVGLNPEVGHEEMASLNLPTAWLRRSGTASSSTSTSTGSTAPVTTRTCGSAPATPRRAFWTVDVVEHGGYDGPHFDYKPPRTEDMDGVWACAGVYAELPDPAEKSKAFRADPEVQQALRDARVDQLHQPTRRGERRDAARGRFDPEEAGRRGIAFERLDQLALEHLL